MESKELSDIGTLMKSLVQMLVDRPEDVVVHEIEGTQATVIEVRVAKPDHGKLVGKQGRTANAIRELLMNYGGKRNRRYLLEVLE